MTFECDCSSMKEMTSSEHWRGGMPQGMDLEIAHHPLNMKHVVNLVIAIDRLKGISSKRVLSSEFRDEDLLSIILDNALDEQLVLELTEAGPPKFSIIEPPLHCTLKDTQKRSLVMLDETMELHAIRLQGGTTMREVHFNMSSYLNPMPDITSGEPVALGIRGTSYFLSCTQSADKPTLNIEKVEDASTLKSISRDSDMVRFLFYRRDIVTNTSLMSAKHRGWFISTAPQDKLPVEMCQEHAERDQTFTVLPS